MSRLLLLLLPAALATGCATLTAPKAETMYVTSSPPGADIRINGAVVGRTPGSIGIDKQSPPRVEVGFPGQPGTSCPVLMSPGGGSVASDALLCLFLFPVGCISFIDAGGNWNVLQTPACSANLGGQPDQAYPGQYPSQYPQQQTPPPQQAYPPQDPQGYPPPPPQGYPPPPPQGYPPPPPGQP